ncbi:mannose-1-phosphate guanylyltransferase/mannose-6-phosphate isomerase [Denitratisoma oestradiolicum]|uniref:mannose-1-phosphate guanylyltransferase n=1 Tax=Denitratisoma oestradiolicum TaxID=311182 RepID=A0A6S6Y671_9PROT|nr:mannose-1-phosphate guanylyltransferase/mannose-6-phosphate isomerase [Denitratisoma oestradiolicum]TWO80675.1 mannose-1-phosphate guanylyltransferase/mannose-6-phosphate isomerase [Denitratisoma oestradiolicum]CAB1371079.1 Mannose-6-phosphate isomerase / Mannose-1-phosphate guanylyl transferase [Denitratisoma oestradiolicum]
MNPLIPIVLSGGAGTRLWPVSREGHPKPFMKLPDGQSLLAKTYLRAMGGDHVADVLTITNRDYYFSSKDEFNRVVEQSSCNVKGSFLLEPFGRNTAPAIALGALWARELHGPGATLLVLPSDHLIQDARAFHANVREAVVAAGEGQLVTFGIPAASPETGFGYIEGGETLGTGLARGIRRFTEKPSLAKAQEFVASGNYFWNSGMFCFTADTLLEELAAHAPQMHQALMACWENTWQASDDKWRVLEIDAQTFGDVPDLSIDYAVMEHSSRGVVVPAAFDWSDIGSWNALGALLPEDEQGNRTQGDTVLIKASNNLIQSEDRLVAVLGVDHLVIVDTPDALLVAHKDHVQDVRQVVTELRTMGHDCYRTHRTVSRPWGTYTVLEEGSRFKIKRLEVRPGAALSLQMHHYRSEHWIVVSGVAKVINGEREIDINTNESTYIPAGHKHRLLNPGVVDLVLIEVQSGDYLGEDDIVRFDDHYGRV